MLTNVMCFCGTSEPVNYKTTRLVINISRKSLLLYLKVIKMFTNSFQLVLLRGPSDTLHMGFQKCDFVNSFNQ